MAKQRTRSVNWAAGHYRLNREPDQATNLQHRGTRTTYLAARVYSTLVLVAAALAGAPTAQAASITVIDDVSPSVVTPGGDFTGNNGHSGFPGIYAQPSFSAAEAFAGQAAVVGGNGFEIVSGNPSGPLEIPDTQNGVTLFGSELQGQTGSCGDPCTGEGAVSFAFAQPQREIGLDIRLIDGGTVTLQFFEPDNTPFEVVFVSGSATNLSRTFRAEAGHFIGGVTLTNVDTFGVAYDNLRLTPIPLPASLFLLGFGAAPLAFVSRHRHRAAGGIQRKN